MTDNKLVSVIIPTYNRADTVGAAIQSALNQTYTPIEVLVIDDGSSDNTSEVVEQLAGATYICIEHAGQAAARNRGLQEANGEFIASLDSDDLWKPDFVKRCVEKLEQDNLDFVFANWEQEEKDGRYSDFLSQDPYLVPYKSKPDGPWYSLNSSELRTLYLNACPSPSSSGIIRKSSLKTGWNHNMRIGDDWCLYLDIVLSKDCNAAFSMEQLWQKKVNDQNLYNGRKWSEVLEHLHIHDVGEFIDRFSSKTSRKEQGILKKKQIKGMVELAKHKAIRDKDYAAFIRLLFQSIGVNPLWTIQTIPVVLRTSMKHRKNRRKRQ